MANKQKQELRLPPQNLEAEQAVLGAVLMDGRALDQVAALVRAEDFYKEAHGRIYSGMQDLYRQREPVDTVTVVNWLTDKGKLEKVGGAYYITGLVEALPSAANVEHYAAIVREKSRARRLIREATEVQAGLYQGELDAQAGLERLTRLAVDFDPEGFRPVEAYVHEVGEAFMRVAEQPGRLRGTASGYMDLDMITGGMKQSEIVVLAARPSQGKTALALNIAYRQAEQGEVVGFVSLEMSAHALIERLALWQARVSGDRYNTGQFTKADVEALGTALAVIARQPLYIDDKAGQTSVEIFGRARRLQRSKGLSLLVVDYLQLMGDEGRNQYERVTAASAGCLRIAKELGIPVLVVCQLSRKPEERGDRIPQMSDLRESGAIEQDAGQIWLIYRPEVYPRMKTFPDGSLVEGRAELIVAKNRNGRAGKCKLKFLGEYAAFESLAKGEQEFPG